MTEKPMAVSQLDMQADPTAGYKGPVTWKNIDIYGYESIEQRSSRFRRHPPNTDTKFFLCLLSISLGIAAVLLSIMALMV